MTKTKHTFGKRTLSLLLALVMLIGLMPQITLPVHALGDVWDCEIDGKEYTVFWDPDKFAHGVIEMRCEYCGATYDREFIDTTDHEAVASDMIEDDFAQNCLHCLDCDQDYHCQFCGECFEFGAIESCPYCDTMLCLGCHDDDCYCDLCGNCRLSDNGGTEYNENDIDVSGHTVSLPNLHVLCQDCIDDIECCANCGNAVCIGGGSYVVADELGEEWCENCGLCYKCLDDLSIAAQFGHCRECGVCESDERVCDDCHLCEEDAVGETHCPECDMCYETQGVMWCETGGEHCVACCRENGWLCEQCGECVEAYGEEFCEDCGLCLSCCADNTANENCTHDYCVESAEYYDHLCYGCGQCPDDMECEYCFLCEDCQQDYHCEHELCPDSPEFEEHVCDACGDCYEIDELCELCHLCDNCWEHCQHDICPEDPDYDDHFCDQCGDCYEEFEFCDACGLCVDCCENNTLSMGCNHGLCVESDEFQDHYCFEDGQCLENCDHPACLHESLSSTWSKNESSHWRQCPDCGASVDCAAHVPGNPQILNEPDILSGKNGVAVVKCRVCGQMLEKITTPCVEIPKDGSPYIISEPKDYLGRFSTDEFWDDGEKEYATFRVYAGGEDDLIFQWYDQNGKPLEEHEKYRIGTKTSTLRAYVYDDACTTHRSYYCVVTNAKGSVKTRTAEIQVVHFYGDFEDKGEAGHIEKCWGSGCGETYGPIRPHHYRPWRVNVRPTETQQGHMYRMCAECNHYQEEWLPPVDPNHVHKYDILKKDDTQHWYACSCGLVQEGVPHSYGAWQHVKLQTVREEGRDERTCSVCGYVEVQLVKKLSHEHNYTRKDRNRNAYMLPNGYVEDDYHVRCCSLCTAEFKEEHRFGWWYIVNYPSTSREGKYHPGTVRRACQGCGYREEKTFTKGKWPIMTEVLDPEKADYNGFDGPASFSGTIVADPGEKVSVTVKMFEGYIPDEFEQGPFEVSIFDQGQICKIEQNSYKVENIQVKDWKYDPATQTLTFTMPNGPVALVVHPKKCDHKGAETYRDTIVPGCTNMGRYVYRCKRCGGVAETLAYLEPLGHAWKMTDRPTVVRGDCYTRAEYEYQCIRCGTYKNKKDNYWHNYVDQKNGVAPTCVKAGRKSDWACWICGELSRKETDKVIPPTGHDWTEWHVTREPTTTIQGIEKRECKTCGAFQTQLTGYSGPDYRVRADQNHIHYNFTYGDKLEPVTVNVSSIGRTPVTGITQVGELIGNVTLQEIDGMQIKLTPQPWIMAEYFGTEGSEPAEILTLSEFSVAGGTREIEGAEIQVTANIRKTKESYPLTVEGGKAYVDGKDRRTARNSWIIPGATLFHLIPDNKDKFIRWQIVEDKSGYLQALMKTYGYNWEEYYSTPMSPNAVTIKALYTDTPGLKVITYDGNGAGWSREPGCTDEHGVVEWLPKPYRSKHVFDGWWTRPEGGERIDVGSVLTEDTTIYAHWRKESDPPLPELRYTKDSKVEAYGILTVDIEAMAGQCDELKQALQDGKVSYQWFNSGSMIAGESKQSYQIPADYVDAELQTIVCFNGHQIVGRPVSNTVAAYGKDRGSVFMNASLVIDPSLGFRSESIYRTMLALDPELASGNADGNVDSYIDLDQDGTSDLRVYLKASHYYCALLPDSNLKGYYSYPVPEPVQADMAVRGKDYCSSIMFSFPRFTDMGTLVIPLHKGAFTVKKVDKDLAVYDTLNALQTHEVLVGTERGVYTDYDFNGDGIWDVEVFETNTSGVYSWYDNRIDTNPFYDEVGYYEIAVPKDVRRDMTKEGKSYYSTVRFVFAQEAADLGTYTLDLSKGDIYLPETCGEAIAIRTTLQCLNKEEGVPALVKENDDEILWSASAAAAGGDFCRKLDYSREDHYAKAPDTAIKGTVCYQLKDLTEKAGTYGNVYYSKLYLKFGETDVGSCHFYLLTDEAELDVKSPEYLTLEVLAQSGIIGQKSQTEGTKTWISYDLDLDGKDDVRAPVAGGKLEICPETRIFGNFSIRVPDETADQWFFNIDSFAFNKEYCSELEFHFTELNRGAYTLDLTKEEFVNDNDPFLRATLSGLIAPNAAWDGPVNVDLDGDGIKDLAVTSSGSDTLYTVLADTTLQGEWTWTATDKQKQRAKFLDTIPGYYEKITFVFPKKTVENPFIDVKEGAFYFEPVLWAVDHAITAGTDKTHFSPNDTCTRAQVVTFLWRAAGNPEPKTGNNPFQDVKPSDYFYKPVLWAAENKITAGTSATTFSPNDGCTRGQVVTFLWRSAGNPAPGSSKNPFTDVKSDAYFYDPVLWAVEHKITVGTSDTTFSPNDTCTRGQIVTFLYRYMES